MAERQHFLTVPEAAERFGVTDQTVRNRIHAGTLTAVKVGRDWRVLTDSVTKSLIIDEYVKRICARAPELTPEDIEALRRIVGPGE